jgi:hypothetical protein
MSTVLSITVLVAVVKCKNENTYQIYYNIALNLPISHHLLWHSLWQMLSYLSINIYLFNFSFVVITLNLKNLAHPDVNRDPAFPLPVSLFAKEG